MHPMQRRVTSLLLLWLAVGFAASPDWVETGTELRYLLTDGSGNSNMLFTVNAIEATDIKITLELTQGSNVRVFRPVDKTDDVSGQFWFDQSRIGGSVFAGQLISGWSADETGTEEIAGKQWDVVKLSKMLDSALIQVTHDKETGLLLRREVSVGGSVVETATFQSIDPPFGALSLDDHGEPPEASPEPAPEPAASPEPDSASESESAPAPAPVSIPSIPPPVAPAPSPVPTAAPAAPGGLPCMPGLVLFGLVGMGIWINKK